MFSTAPRFRFSDWPNRAIPSVAAGVYAIWDTHTLVYCGMSGRQFEEAQAAKKTRYGLVTRLGSHASGRLSGDQFCVYVANRLVVPTINNEDRDAFRKGSLTLDSLTRRYIHARFEYQYVVVPSSSSAYALERQCRNGEIFGAKPFLNPL